MARVDVNDISPEARAALLEFSGALLGLEDILKAKGASPAEIEKGAIEAVTNILKSSPKEKKAIKNVYNSRKEA